MNNGTPVCPACGSTSTYVRKQDGKVCCKSCGHGVKRRAGAVQHECPLCRSKQVYYRSKTGEYACRRCGFFTHARGTAGDLKEGFLASLPPFREIRRGRPAADTRVPLPPAATPASPTLTINGHPLALKQEAGTVWLVVEAPGGGFPFAGPFPYQIPVYEAEFLIDLDLPDPAAVAEAWKTVLTRAKIGRDDFLKEFPAKLDGLTPAQVTDLQAKGLLSQRALDRVLIAFREEKLPGDTSNVGYAAMLFEIGLLDRVDEELAAVRDALARLQQEDEDGIPAGSEEKRYHPVPVPEDLPPVEAITVSFDGGKTRWVFVASHLAEGGGL
jgi:predicted RNA-binding Zn-ribbon protein involved in translation (DUF1610 family)